MKFTLTSTIDSLRDDLKKSSKSISLDEVLNWNSNIWGHLVALTAGLDPFSGVGASIIPDVFKAFLPRIAFKPTLEDRKTAYLALRNGLTHVNKAIVETTRSTYDQFITGPFPSLFELVQQSYPGGLDEFLGALEAGLWDYNTRQMYLQAGVAMMTSEQIWLSRHHSLAIAVVGYYEANSKKPLTDKEFIDLCNHVGVLENNKITFNPLQQADAAPPQISQEDPLSKVLANAQSTIKQSKGKLLDQFKGKKKK